MPKTTVRNKERDKLKVARYRERMRASGADQVLFELPRETIAMLDELKKRQGLRNRSLVLRQLIERGIQAIGGSPETHKPTSPNEPLRNS
jgi:hypothetical protein